MISTPQDAALSARLRALADAAPVSAVLHRSAGVRLRRDAGGRRRPARCASRSRPAASRRASAKILQSSGCRRARREVRALSRASCAERRRRTARRSPRRGSDGARAMLRRRRRLRRDVRSTVRNIRDVVSRRATDGIVEIVTVGTELLLGHSSTRTRPSSRRRWPITASTLREALGRRQSRAARSDARGVLEPRGRRRHHDRRARARRSTTSRRSRRGRGRRAASAPRAVAARDRDALTALRPADELENNRRQASCRRGAIVMDNPHGTAPGLHRAARRREVRRLRCPAFRAR